MPELNLDALLASMAAFPAVCLLQRQACWLMLTLAASNAVVEAIIASGGVGALLAAMVNCPRDASVQHFGLWALTNLGWADAKARAHVRQQGAVEACRAAIEQFPKPRGVVEKANLCILQLAADSEDRPP